MKTSTIAILYVMLALVSCATTPCTLSAAPGPVRVDSLLQKEFSSAEEIVASYNTIRQQIKGSSQEAYTENLCNYIWQSGEYMFCCRGKNKDIALLPQNVEEISFDDETVKAFMIERDTARFADHYFTLKAMKRGDSFEDSRDGITITVFYRPRSMNGNDYVKMKEVFSCNNDALHIVYMKKLKFPFRNSGCNEELYSVRPFIEKNVKESKLKSEIIALFNLYKDIMPGEPAATPVLKDAEGKEYTFADFRGKVLVIDVWATWCSSCLAGMPKYIALRESYRGNPNVEFITVSIDRKESRESWLAAIEKRKMGDMLNLTPDCSEESLFESKYHISGIPRYIIIDKEGNIVTAYAPPPGGGMEEIIEKTTE
jgi:thiol-disulfide isomerase/thioredoxin